MTLALAAGWGRLPGLVLQALEARGEQVQLWEMEGFPMDDAGGREVRRYRLETLGSFIATLKETGVTRICFAGAVTRPRVDPAKIDAATWPLVPRIQAALAKGDDGSLRVALAFFEEAGLKVVGVQDLVPELVPAAGAPTRAQPDEQAKKDARRGQSIVAALGAADVGQACVVSRGQALAIEAMPGTAWMLASVAAARDGIPARGLVRGEGTDAMSPVMEQAVTFLAGEAAQGPLHLDGLPGGGLLFKAPKPGQDRRVDLPTIGPDTVRQAAAAGLAGIVVEAGGVLVLDAPEVISAADDLGLFLWLREPE
ncbi:LpxI family protein [Oceaniglobus roseus]|uniref:LpxI family protein n=1 Tax=Oceaniglobus roseus TaxID=1737570 RepID=UPI0012FFE44D|nr:UDP-2,3-diacylglucosamine diphosphatase LpxI [Kandeliimicrobium roseum]